MCSVCFGHQMSGCYLDITLASDWPRLNIQATYRIITAFKIMNLPQQSVMHHNPNRRELNTSINI